MSPASEPDAWVERCLSAPRFHTYVENAGGDRGRALALYGWNARVAASLIHDIGYLEVGLRNAYDLAVSGRWRGRHHWLLDPEGPVCAPLTRTRGTGKQRHRVDINERTRQQVQEAKRRCASDARVGKVIAELPFGFWRYLTASAREKTLWVPYLHHAFPPGVDRRELDERVGRLHAVRNRAAHHEPLILLDLGECLDELLDVCDMVSPMLADHVAGLTDLPRLLTERPVG